MNRYTAYLFIFLYINIPYMYVKFDYMYGKQDKTIMFIYNV